MDTYGARASGTTSYAYTDGRLTEVTHPDGSTVGYGYDAAGRRTSVTYPDGGVVRYEYDADGLLTGVVDQTGAPTTYRLDLDGRVVEATMPGGVTRRYGYVAGELSAFTEARPGRTSTTRITRDDAGRVAEEVTDGVLRRYAYDAAGQLVRATGVLGEPIRLAYDAVGNRTSVTRGLVTARLTYDAADQLTRSATGPLAVTYGYDERGQLVSASGVGTRLSVAYDGLGRPTATTAGVGSARVTYATSYGGEGLVDTVTRSTSRGSSTTRYRWSDDPVPQVLTQTGADPASFVYGHGRISAVADGTTAVFSADVRGSALRTTATSPWVQALAYDVLGTPIGLPTLDLGFGYRGELGIGPFVHLRDRTLETATGRFTTRDRLDGIPGTVGSQNGYVYGFNDPMNQVDPLGQRAVSDAAFALAAFGGGQQACPDPSGYKRQWKCFQGVSLRTRGYLALPNAIGRDYTHANQAWTTYWNTRRPERAAHTFTIRHLNWSRMTWVQKYLNGNLSVGDGMDWEVAPPNSSWRIDIVVDESEIFEVKRWDNGARIADVGDQLFGYQTRAAALARIFRQAAA